jgi:hypothetical protein
MLRSFFTSKDYLNTISIAVQGHARDFVYLQYQLWRVLYDTLPGNSEFPDEVDVQFLPIGVRTGNVATLGVIIAKGRRDGSAD